jgi:MFS family permease
MKIHANVKLLAWLNFFIDFKIFAPLAIIYFAKVSGSYVLGMSVFSIIMITQAIFELPTGIFSDYIGRRKTVILGAVASVFSLVLYAIGVNYTVLVVGAILEGLSRALYSGNNDALLYDSLRESNQEKEYDEYLGKTSSLFQVAAALAALLSGIVALVSFPFLMWVSVLAHLPSVLLAVKLKEPSVVSPIDTNVFSHTKEALKLMIKNYKLRMLTVASMLGYALGETSYQFRSAFVATLWPVWAIGLAKFLSSAGAGLSYYFSGWGIRRYGELKVLVLGRLISKFANIFPLVFPTVLSPAILSASSLTHGIENVAKSSLMQKEFTDKQRATMSSLTSLLGSLAFAVFGLMLGTMADLWGPTRALLITQVLSVPVILIYWRMFRGEKLART